MVQLGNTQHTSFLKFSVCYRVNRRDLAAESSQLHLETQIKSKPSPNHMSSPGSGSHSSFGIWAAHTGFDFWTLSFANGSKSDSYAGLGKMIFTGRAAKFLFFCPVYLPFIYRCETQSLALVTHAACQRLCPGKHSSVKYFSLVATNYCHIL